MVDRGTHSSSEASPEPSSRTLWIALALATAVFAPFAVSAFLFLRLPPPGASALDLGWGLERLGEIKHVTLEPGDRLAWILVESLVAPETRTLTACHVGLRTARAALRATRHARSE